jgi:DNA-directed RNA polymerase omega subunit
MPTNKVPENRFTYVVLAARRARQLQAGARPLVDMPRSQKHTRIAQEELEQGWLEYELPEIFSVPEEKEGKKRK